MDRISPSWKEELKRLPKELLHPTLEQAIGIKPFTKNEIKWLLDKFIPSGRKHEYILSEVGIFWGYEEFAKMFRYYQDPEKYDHIIQGKYVKTVYDYGAIFYIVGKRTNPTYTNDLYPYLEERLDSGIIKDSGVSVGHNEGNIHLKANIVLLDLRNVYSIMEKRFDDIGAIDSGRKAAKATIQILNNIVDDYAPAANNNSLTSHNIKLLALILYLAVNADMFGLAKLENYLNTNWEDISNTYLEGITDKCEELYNLITDMFMNMQF